MIFYTNFFVPQQHIACARGPFIFIRPEYSGDTGLLAHEQTHVRQFWRSPFLHGWRYLFSKPYRLQCEVAAYRQQLQHGGDVEKFAELLSQNYNLGVSKEFALEELKRA